MLAASASAESNLSPFLFAFSLLQRTIELCKQPRRAQKTKGGMPSKMSGMYRQGTESDSSKIYKAMEASSGSSSVPLLTWRKHARLHHYHHQLVHCCLASRPSILADYIRTMRTRQSFSGLELAASARVRYVGIMCLRRTSVSLAAAGLLLPRDTFSSPSFSLLFPCPSRDPPLLSRAR